MINIKEVADKADVIINGYAFTKCELGFRVLNLNNPEHAVVFSQKGVVLETTMDDIEIDIVSDYLEKNRKYMED
jgi:hypothetical protein